MEQEQGLEHYSHHHHLHKKKWRGEVAADLPATAAASAEEVWSLLSDFCGIHEWIPTLDACRRVEGTNGQPGCIRFCSGKAGWAKERLLAVDHARRSYSYEVVESNIGLGTYVATLRVMAAGCPGAGGCRLVWSFKADPIKGWTLEGFLSFLAVRVRAMAKKLEEATRCR